ERGPDEPPDGRRVASLAGRRLDTVHAHPPLLDLGGESSVRGPRPAGLGAATTAAPQPVEAAGAHPLEYLAREPGQLGSQRAAPEHGARHSRRTERRRALAGAAELPQSPEDEGGQAAGPPRPVD